MRSISGFNNSSLSGSFAAGQPLSATALNKIGNGVDMARTMPSNDVVFVANNGGASYSLMPQVYQQEGSGAATTFYQQYQLEVASIEVSGGVFAQKLKLAKGTVNFTQSNMPRVRLGGHSDQRQAWLFRSAVLGAGVTATQGADTSTIWMEANGYYNITSAGTYYVTISKFDINQSNDDTESVLLNAEVPFISIFKSGDPIESAIFSETGPSEYVNKTNIHKMTGYTAAATGLSGDWGNCHTTWFNPVKWGYSVKLIGIVTAVVDPTSGGFVMTVDQHILGPIDLQIPCLFNGTTLCNQDDLNEVNDPYNLNKDADPAWSDIVNSNDLTAFEEITPVTDEWFQEFIGPADWTSLNYSYLIPASCANQDDGDACSPFRVHDVKDLAEFRTYEICPGTVNNLMPQVFNTVTEAWEYLDDLTPGYQLIPNFTAGECWVALRVGADATTGEFPALTPNGTADDPYPRIITQGSDPAGSDSDLFGFVTLAKITEVGGGAYTVEQYVTGSLWGDRIKLGTQVAQYYYARI